jgi:hypothetical protein
MVIDPGSVNKTKLEALERKRLHACYPWEKILK